LLAYSDINRTRTTVRAVSLQALLFEYMSFSQPLLNSSISSNSFLHIPPPSPQDQAESRTPHIIFFIPGNPGLISYYHTFLSLLSDPKTSPSTSGCVIAGFSLGGFEVSTGASDDDVRTKLLYPEDGPQGPLYSLQEQVRLTSARVDELVRTLRGQVHQRKEEAPDDDRTRAKWNVILIGHSVGAYIALEVLRLHREQHVLGSQSAIKKPGGRRTKDFEITADILLTPTVVDIALSSSGRVVAPVLNHVPGFPLLVSLGASFIMASLPKTWLKGVVRIVIGRDTPEDAIASTVSFLGSRNGVRQSLGMAADEMKEIGRDAWGEEVWGVIHASKKEFEDRELRLWEPAQLFFYFAKSDHWVADRTREAIIDTRGGKGGIGKPRMTVAEENELVHGWCIRNNGFVAQKVDGWVEEIFKAR
jgi:pimeloyl-ACP methyl ester carboxylesterase